MPQITTHIKVPRMIFRWKKMDKIMKKGMTTTTLLNFTTTMNSENQRRYLPHLPQCSKSENEAVNVDNAIPMIIATLTCSLPFAESPDSEPPAAKEITFITSITSAAEMKKLLSKRTSRNKSFILNLNEPWDTMKAQILVKISDALNPRHLSYDDYDVSWFIPRILLKPGLSLLSQNDFNGLMKRAANLTSKDPTINITVIQKNEHKENEALKEAAAVLPGNHNKIKNIRNLREHWICKKPDAACASTHCYVDPSTDEHIPLNPERFDCWASAMLKDDGMATLEKPPHHRLFDAQNPVISPVLQNEVLGLFHPEGSTAPTIPVAAALNPPSDPACTTLLHPSRTQGRDIPLNMFCAEYDLGDNIHLKLINNAYKEAQFLCFVTIAELKEMGFQLGEIAAIRDAVEQWSVPRV
ncbi:hypothetical protein K503DRAFT_798526 [Rhizopogon vinicolor AM-OR11-026]|uniref:SAM domain-containing protein n=1 Tax=Rhizopogon vinicolor AM-OR11-026 TaxID=1314800 RepID=A0A1B7N7E7_9AGAM|nr:hypothetical protein K503DRAFT_798526 [Rhizopogon vinicolor AM-OR11-026]